MSDANDIQPIPLKSERVDKKWGYELVVCNNDEFCGKILHFNKGTKFSSHFHKLKREVFYLIGGKVNLMTINPKDASQTNRIMVAGDIIEIPRLCPHQITALEESEIVEFSTHHEDSDSYRVLPGDSQLTK